MSNGSAISASPSSREPTAYRARQGRSAQRGPSTLGQRADARPSVGRMLRLARSVDPPALDEGLDAASLRDLLRRPREDVAVQDREIGVLPDLDRASVDVEV